MGFGRVDRATGAEQDGATETHGDAKAKPDNLNAAQRILDVYLGDDAGGGKDGNKDGDGKKGPDPETCKKRYRVALGNLLGNSAYVELDSLLTQYGMTDQLVAMGHGLVDDLVKSITAQASTGFGLADPEKCMQQLMTPVSAMLKAKADAWLDSAQGRKLVDKLSTAAATLFREHPWAAIGACLLAGAAAYAADMPIEPIAIGSKLGKHMTAAAKLDLGSSLKEIALGTLSATMQYTATHLRMGLSGERSADGAISGVFDLSAESKKKVDAVVTHLALDDKGHVSGTAKASHHEGGFNADLDALLSPTGDVTAKLLLVLKDTKKVDQLLVNFADVEGQTGGSAQLLHQQGGLKAMLDLVLGPQGELSSALEVLLHDKAKVNALALHLAHADGSNVTGDVELSHQTKVLGIDAKLVFDKEGKLTESFKLALADAKKRNELRAAFVRMGDRVQSATASYTHTGKAGSVSLSGTSQEDQEGRTTKGASLTLADKKKQNELSTGVNVDAMGTTTETVGYTRKKGTSALSATAKRTQPVDDAIMETVDVLLTDTDRGLSLSGGTKIGPTGMTTHGEFTQQIQRGLSTTDLSSGLTVDTSGKVGANVGVHVQSDVSAFNSTAELKDDKLAVSLACKTPFGKTGTLESSLHCGDVDSDVHLSVFDTDGKIVESGDATYDRSTGTLLMKLRKGPSLSVANKEQPQPLPGVRAEEQLAHFKLCIAQQLGHAGQASVGYDPSTRGLSGKLDFKQAGFHLGGGGSTNPSTSTRSWFASVGYEDEARFQSFMLELERTYTPAITTSELHGVVAFAVDQTRLRFEGVGQLTSETGGATGSARGVVSQPVWGGIRALGGAQVDFAGGATPKWSVLGGAEYAGIPVYVSYGGLSAQTGKGMWSVGILMPLQRKPR